MCVNIYVYYGIPLILVILFIAEGHNVKKSAPSNDVSNGNIKSLIIVFLKSFM